MNKKFLPALRPLARVENDPAKREEAIKKNLPIRFEITKDNKKEGAGLDKVKVNPV